MLMSTCDEWRSGSKLSKGKVLDQYSLVKCCTSETFALGFEPMTNIWTKSNTRGLESPDPLTVMALTNVERKVRG